MCSVFLQNENGKSKRQPRIKLRKKEKRKTQTVKKRAKTGNKRAKVPFASEMKQRARLELERL